MALQNSLLNSVSGKRRRSQYFDPLVGESPAVVPVATNSPTESNLGKSVTQGVMTDQQVQKDLQPTTDIQLPELYTHYGEPENVSVAPQDLQEPTQIQAPDNTTGQGQAADILNPFIDALNPSLSRSIQKQKARPVVRPIYNLDGSVYSPFGGM